MKYLVHTKRSRDIIRMGPATFIQLCEQIRATEVVKDAYHSIVEEQVAKFLHIIGQKCQESKCFFFFPSVWRNNFSTLLQCIKCNFDVGRTIHKASIWY